MRRHDFPHPDVKSTPTDRRLQMITWGRCHVCHGSGSVWPGMLCLTCKGTGR